MSETRRSAGGSRYLFEPFEYGPSQVREAQERVLDMQFEALDLRLTRVELVMERLEKRLWLTVYGVAGTILAQAFGSFITITP